MSTHLREADRTHYDVWAATPSRSLHLARRALGAAGNFVDTYLLGGTGGELDRVTGHREASKRLDELHGDVTANTRLPPGYMARKNG